jgi:hypothetical protein
MMKRLDSVHTLISLPRYDEFRDAIRRLADADTGVRITEIAGNREIFLTGVAPADWKFNGADASVVFELPLPTDASRKRVTMRVSVGDLLAVVRRMNTDRQLMVDHIYDY